MMGMGIMWVVETAAGNLTHKPLPYTRAVEVLKNWEAAGLAPKLLQVDGPTLARLRDEYTRAADALRALTAQAKAKTL